jgi:hypothetical protein
MPTIRLLAAASSNINQVIGNFDTTLYSVAITAMVIGALVFFFGHGARTKGISLVALVLGVLVIAENREAVVGFITSTLHAWGIL